MDVDNAPIMQKLCHLFQDITMISQNAIYYKSNVQCWVICMKVVSPLFEELQEISGPLNDDEVSNLHTLEAVCLKMKELLGKCAAKTSKSSPVSSREIVTLPSFYHNCLLFCAIICMVPPPSMSISYIGAFNMHKRWRKDKVWGENASLKLSILEIAI